MGKCNGITIRGFHSCRDFGQCYATREVAAPEKRVVTETVPYRNGRYDFSDLLGEVFYDNRTITYTFDFIGDTAFDVQKQVDDLTSWLIETTNDEIYDDEMPYYHWYGSCDTVDTTYDEEGIAAQSVATFSVYPFRIANDLSEVFVKVGANEVLNQGRAARLTVKPSGSSMTIQVGAVRQTFYGETLADISIPPGRSTITVTGGSGTIKWREEHI